MKEDFERELEKPESWEYERPIVRRAVTSSRVIVSVAFKRDDFIKVSEFARRLGAKTSEFIREAALEKATGQGWILNPIVSGSLGASLIVAAAFDTTKVQTLVLNEQFEEAAPVTT